MLRQSKDRKPSYDDEIAAICQRPEIVAFSALIAAHWQRTARNPTDAECNVMAGIAGEMAATGAVLQ